MFLRLTLVATLAALLVQEAVARPENNEVEEFVDTKPLAALDQPLVANRIVEGKSIVPLDVFTKNSEVKNLIATKGFIKSVFTEGAEVILGVVWAPFYWIGRIADYFVLVPRLAIEGLLQWHRARKSAETVVVTAG